MKQYINLVGFQKLIAIGKIIYPPAGGEIHSESQEIINEMVKINQHRACKRRNKSRKRFFPKPPNKISSHQTGKDMD